jgi:hypothetical protein
MLFSIQSEPAEATTNGPHLIHEKFAAMPPERSIEARPAVGHDMMQLALALIASGSTNFGPICIAVSAGVAQGA